MERTHGAPQRSPRHRSARYALTYDRLSAHIAWHGPVWSARTRVYEVNRISELDSASSMSVLLCVEEGDGLETSLGPP